MRLWVSTLTRWSRRQPALRHLLIRTRRKWELHRVCRRLRLRKSSMMPRSRLLKLTSPALRPWVMHRLRILRTVLRRPERQGQVPLSALWTPVFLPLVRSNREERILGPGKWADPLLSPRDPIMSPTTDPWLLELTTAKVGAHFRHLVRRCRTWPVTERNALSYRWDKLRGTRDCICLATLCVVPPAKASSRTPYGLALRLRS